VIKTKALAPVYPNVGIEAEYRRALESMIGSMHRSSVKFVTAAYRKAMGIPKFQHANPLLHSAVAYDAPLDDIRQAIREMAKRWEARFEAAAPRLAAYFAQAAYRRTNAALMQILKDAGITVKFALTPASRAELVKAVASNVGLIKSIPQKFHAKLETDVLKSFAVGQDMRALTRVLEERYGVTRRRAALIANDQNSKLTASLTEIRQRELGIRRAYWLHSGGGRTPRPNHVQFSNQKRVYDISTGMWDPDANGKGKGAWIRPGTLINCRCVSRAIIPAVG
jgi:uncharacterized protein with gpF-like domain